MLKDRTLATALNSELRRICEELDQTAARVRADAPHEAPQYARAIGKVFQAIMSELLDPLYREHPELAPNAWYDSQQPN